jgi:hypothetical protein
VKGRKAAQERFSEESFRIVTAHSPETHFSNSTVKSADSRGTDSLQQAWINSRNSTTIATHAKHRQPMF